MNAAAFAAISRLEAVHYVGPVDPPVVYREKVISKLLRMAGAQGAFSFFSQRRLATIACAVSAGCRADARLDFFHGFTPWILTEPRRPYLAWSDCTFADYVSIYHRRDRFQPRDLARIEADEARWLKNAARILFTSEWAAKRATSQYDLDPSRVGVAGIFGEIDAPASDAYRGGKGFVFVSTDFEAKGGRIVSSAFRRVREHCPEATLVVVGDRPRDVHAEPGVAFTGFLRKENPGEHARLREILGQARALVHPTLRDICPLIVVEAGYFGCPAIASRSFAIPELIDDERTGILLNDPSQVETVANAMIRLLDNEEEYREMRRAAFAKAHGERSKVRFEERLLSHARPEAS